MARTPAPQPHRPAQLTVTGDDAKRRIQLRIDAADPFLDPGAISSVDGFIGDSRTWEATTTDLLNRLFDSSDFADKFTLARHRRIAVTGRPSPALDRVQFVQGSIGSQVRYLRGVLEMIDNIVELPAAQPEKPEPISPRSVHYTFTAPIYGTVVADSITRNITNLVDAKSGTDAATLAHAFKTLFDAFVGDPDLAEVRDEVLENLDYLSESAVSAPEKRRPSIIARAFARITALIPVATQAGKAWGEWEPIIEQALHAHH
jgi:hypothetical protein